jgi:hypothetical protein
MSKRSRRRNARVSEKLQTSIEPPTSLPKQVSTDTAKTAQRTLTPIATSRGRFGRRRILWLAVIVCLVGIAGTLISGLQKTQRPGIIEYSSDDLNAQVILEKDGQEILLERATKFTKQVEPGSYKLRLENPTEGLKLQPSIIQMDPGGRAFVTVRRVQKAAPR